MNKRFLLVIVIIINLIIWINSMLPASISTSQSGLVANSIYPIFKNLFTYREFTLLIRKTAHFLEFLILGFFVAMLYSKYQLKLFYVLALVHTMIVAMIDEFIQLFVDGRAGLITDVLIDTSGAIVGILISVLVIKMIHKKE